MPIGLDKTDSRSAINVLSIVQYKSPNTGKLTNADCREKNSVINLNENTHIENTGNCLRIEVIRKMICRFLTEKKMPKQNLAEALGITVKGLNQLCSKRASQALMLKVNLPLVKLYCKTRF